MFVSTGDPDCPGLYQLVVLDAKGERWRSSIFGNCSTPKLQFGDRAITSDYPSRLNLASPNRLLSIDFPPSRLAYAEHYTFDYWTNSFNVGRDSFAPSP